MQFITDFSIYFKSTPTTKDQLLERSEFGCYISSSKLAGSRTIRRGKFGATIRHNI